jgi:hypothetical protein
VLGVTGPLDADCGGLRWVGEGACGQCAQGGQQELLELLLQGIVPARSPENRAKYGPGV